MRTTRRRFLFCAGIMIGVHRCAKIPAEVLTEVNPRRYFSQINRVIGAMTKVDSPVSASDIKQLAAFAQENDLAAVEAAERLLAPYTLLDVTVDSKSTGYLVPGTAPKALVQQGWRAFTVRVANPTGLKEKIALSTSRTPFPEGPGLIRPFPSAGWDDFHPPGKDPQLDVQQAARLIRKMWLLSEIFGTTNVNRGGVDIPAITLSGEPIEYQVIDIFSRDAGRQKAKFALYSFPANGALPQVAASRTLGFECTPAHQITLRIRDVDGRGCTAALIIRDGADRCYPPRLMRVVPDRPFHDEIYRSDGETIKLANGTYTLESTRGPEYLRVRQKVVIDGQQNDIDVNLQRWIDPAKWGWYSGDMHIHGNCCVPYRIPEGVGPTTMIRELRGEDLAVAEPLAYAYGWKDQIRYFNVGAQSPAATLEYQELQRANSTSLIPYSAQEDLESTVHYGIETSVFPSDPLGHLVLLKLRTLQYPGATVPDEWPSWNLPILRWAKDQGGAVGYGHSGFGLGSSTDLPNYDIPPFNDVGANEAIVDATYGLVDFLGGCDTNPWAELNLWYHLLNCGFRMAFLGESDYPGLTWERPGLGRSYVRLDQRPIGDVGYNKWVQGMQLGRLYCGDGRSHFLDFRVNDRRTGEGDLVLDSPGAVTVEALAAARLNPEPPRDTKIAKLNAEPSYIKADRYNGWHLEKARLGATREVAVELVVNGRAVNRTPLTADGTSHTLKFGTSIAHSSWVSLRIFPSSHTHPVFVRIGNNAIRASKNSARWCRACIDKVWEVASLSIRESDRPAASEAFDHARKTYDTIISESVSD